MKNATEKLQKMAASLATFSDTFEVRAHLAKQEAKDAWLKLEPVIDAQRTKADKLLTEIKSLKGEAELQTYLGMKELGDKLDLVTERLEHLIQAGKADAKTGVDLARLKVELAAMDTEDYLSEKKMEVEKAYTSSKYELKNTLAKTFDKVSTRINSLLH